MFPISSRIVCTAQASFQGLDNVTRPVSEPIAPSMTMTLEYFAVFSRHISALSGSGSIARMRALGNRLANHIDAAPALAPASTITGTLLAARILSYLSCTRRYWPELEKSYA